MKTLSDGQYTTRQFNGPVITIREDDTIELFVYLKRGESQHTIEIKVSADDIRITPNVNDGDDSTGVTLNADRNPDGDIGGRIWEISLS
jgi:hypothetical protein